MKTTRRSAIFGSLATGIGAGSAGQALSSCAPGAMPFDGEKTRVTVLGVLHGRHRRSKKYSLEVLREAVRRAKPDVILTEIPPDRIAEAKRSFAETGEVTERRTKVFPEYTDVVFPLSREMDFSLVGTAGWTRDLADERSAALKRIENDPQRAREWQEDRAARAEFSRLLNGKGDDPRFIHTREYDAMTQRSRTPYQIYFDPDLGPGGWTRINAAHTGLINQSLDTISGQGAHALVMFGAAHKYMIERALFLRNDIAFEDARALFD